MEFPKTLKEENQIAWQEGLRIYGELRKKYCNESIGNLDIILNSLCCALIRLFFLNSEKIDIEECSELVKQIIAKNLKAWHELQVDVNK